MDGRPRSGQRIRSGLTLVELLVAIAVLGVLGGLLLSAQTSAPTPPPPLPPAPPAPPPVVLARYGSELSLQTTLDRLGFTVNVPRSYQGRRLANGGPGHASTRSDEVPAERFRADGPVLFSELSRQADLGTATTFRADTTAGDEVVLFGRVDPLTTDQPARSRDRLPAWALAGSGRVGSDEARTATCGLHGPFRLSIDFPNNSYTRGPLFSTAKDNPGGASQLLVLSARRGGTWVDEGERTGHWEGGSNTGAYLLCWEDTVHGDNDFQDLVISAEGISPEE
jgi:prepilin-type N-terminal cleavage/methylation domain-containing protein